MASGGLAVYITGWDLLSLASATATSCLIVRNKHDVFMTAVDQLQGHSTKDAIIKCGGTKAFKDVKIYAEIPKSVSIDGAKFKVC